MSGMHTGKGNTFWWNSEWITEREFVNRKETRRHSTVVSRIHNAVYNKHKDRTGQPFLLTVKREISGSQGGKYEDDDSQVIAPRSLVEVYRRFRGACCLHHDSPGTSANFYKITWILIFP
jgi:hypothetical protein